MTCFPDPTRLERRALLAGLSALPIAAGSAAIPAQAQGPADPLASWNDGSPKQAIPEFVRATTDRASLDFVPAEDRIATFDQDGTLWTEHPLYTQAMFALDRVHMLAPQHPEWQNQEPFKTVLSSDPNGAAVVRKPASPSTAYRPPATTYKPRATVTCAQGVYRAGCAGPNGAAVIRR